MCEVALLISIQALLSCLIPSPVANTRSLVDCIQNDRYEIAGKRNSYRIKQSNVAINGPDFVFVTLFIYWQSPPILSLTTLSNPLRERTVPGTSHEESVSMQSGSEGCTCEWQRMSARALLAHLHIALVR